MRTFLPLSALLLSGVAAFPLQTSAKDCYVGMDLKIVRSNGTVENAPVQYLSDPLVLTLDPGDVVSVNFWSNMAAECNPGSRFVLHRDGASVLDMPSTFQYTLTISEPGYYAPTFPSESIMGVSVYYAPAFFVTTPGNTSVLLGAKAWLDGPYAASTGMMNDDLRAGGLLPLTVPGYPASTISASVLTVTGPNAIVDRVYVSLQHSSSNRTTVGSQWALIQRDGDIVALDGSSSLQFPVPSGNYFVTVRHRNHLGVMTAAPVALSGTTTTVDFRSPALATYGTDARKNLGAQRLLWCGQTGSSSEYPKRISYTGAANDRDRILVRVGGSLPTSTITGYYDEDVNMDGVVKYTGANNDRDRILSSVGGSLPTAVRNEQMP